MVAAQGCLPSIPDNPQPKFVERQSINPLPKAAEDLELFLCLAYFDNLGFLAERPDELPFVTGAFPLVAEAVGRAAR